jgi:hypothetical protein
VIGDSVRQQIKFGNRTTPIEKDLTQGGWTSSTTPGPGNWMFTEAQGWRHWKFVCDGNATGFVVQIEVTTDRQNILRYPSGAMRAGSEGTATVATITAEPIITGMNVLLVPQEYDRAVVAVRANLITAPATGTLYVMGTVTMG